MKLMKLNNDKILIMLDELYYNDNNTNNDIIYYYKIIDWIRQKYGIYTEIHFEYEGKFKICILSEAFNIIKYFDLDDVTYNDALVMATQKALEYVKTIETEKRISKFNQLS